MFRLYLNKKGVVLYMVLATVLIVTILANVVLNIILSQSRLTHHQISRIQAYYASQAGMNLALEKLRTGVWTTGNYSLCSSGCNVTDTDIPYRVDIVIGAPGTGISGTQKIDLTTTYTYTP